MRLLQTHKPKGQNVLQEVTIYSYFYTGSSVHTQETDCSKCELYHLVNTVGDAPSLAVSCTGQKNPLFREKALYELLPHLLPSQL